MGDDIGDGPRPLTVHLDDGVDLEAELLLPMAPRAAVLLTHPHPLFGGSMRSLVTSELFLSLVGTHWAALRFNFRGVESSTGTHGGGRDEQRDVQGALDALWDALGGDDADIPVVLAGWSFGADVGLAVTDPRLTGWFLVAPPLRILRDEEFLGAHDPRPKRLVIGEHDEFNPPPRAAERTASWTNTELVAVPGADHFFAGRTGHVAGLLEQFVALLGQPGPTRGV